MPFEQVDILMPGGQRHGPIDLATLRSWVQQGNVPPDAQVVDRATGQQQPLSALIQLVGAASGPRTSSVENDGVATVIPYRNMPALVGYYLGVFSFASCIPLVGILGMMMGIAATVLGIMGLKKVRAFPQVKGTAHAWIAIVCGTVFTLGGLVINIMVIGALMASRR